MSRFDEIRSALRSMDGALCAFHSPTLLSIIAELRRGDVTDQRLKVLQSPTRHAIGSSSRPSLMPSNVGAGKSVAIVSLYGVALYDLDYFPLCFSTKALARTIAALAADPSVASIVLDINTPGGQVTGTMEAADAVFSARSRKPVVGIVNALCASAGYWIGSQCSSLIAVPSGEVGSIGVFMCHLDVSKALAEAGVKPTFISAGPHKTEGNSFEPLGADAKAFYQKQVDQTYADFTGAVARGRGVTTDAVKARMGGGRCLDAKMALRAGMIDAVQAPDQALQRIVAGSLPSRSAISPAAEHRARIAELAAESMSPAERARKSEVERVRRRIAILSA